MGNCMISSSNKSSEQYQKEEARVIKEANTEESKSSRVDDDGKSGVVRLRVVVTQRELHQLLNLRSNNNFSSSSKELLISALKLRGRIVSDVGEKDDGGDINCSSWRPVLESIPENHS